MAEGRLASQPSRWQIWVWSGPDLSIIYAGTEMPPILGSLAGLTVEAIMAMAQQR